MEIQMEKATEREMNTGVIGVKIQAGLQFRVSSKNP